MKKIFIFLILVMWAFSSYAQPLALFENYTFIGIPDTTGKTVPHILSDYSVKRVPRYELRGSNCLNLDGTNEYIDCTNFEPSGGSGATLSIFAWVSLTDVTNQRWVFSKYQGNPPGNQRSWFLIVESTTGYFGVAVSSNADGSSRKRYTVQTNVADGNPHLLAITWNSDTLKVYIDGIEQTPVKTEDFSFTNIYQGSASVYIGSWNNLAATYFKGKIWGCGTTSDALSSQEIFNLYHGILPSDNITSYYPLESGSGAYCYDVSGNNRHGTGYNTPGISTVTVGNRNTYNFTYGYCDSSGLYIPMTINGNSFTVDSLYYPSKPVGNNAPITRWRGYW